MSPIHSTLDDGNAMGEVSKLSVSDSQINKIVASLSSTTVTGATKESRAAFSHLHSFVSVIVRVARKKLFAWPSRQIQTKWPSSHNWQSFQLESMDGFVTGKGFAPTPQCTVHNECHSSHLLLRFYDVSVRHTFCLCLFSFTILLRNNVVRSFCLFVFSRRRIAIDSQPTETKNLNDNTPENRVCANPKMKLS